MAFVCVAMTREQLEAEISDVLLRYQNALATPSTTRDLCAAAALKVGVLAGTAGLDFPEGADFTAETDGDGNTKLWPNAPMQRLLHQLYQP